MSLKNFLRGEMDITSRVWDTLEDLRAAIEIWTGSRIRFRGVHLDRGFSSGRGFFEADEKTYPFVFRECLWDIDGLFLEIDIDGLKLSANVNSSPWIRVRAEIPLGFPGPVSWWVGTSFADRVQEEDSSCSC